MNDTTIIDSETPSRDDCNMAVLAHLLGIFTGFIAAAVIFLMTRDKSPFVARQAKEALNFQITIFIGFMIGWVLSIVLIGFFINAILLLLNFILCIMAAIEVSKGKPYQYPFALRLIQ